MFDWCGGRRYAAFADVEEHRWRDLAIVEAAADAALAQSGVFILLLLGLSLSFYALRLRRFGFPLLCWMLGLLSGF